MKKKLSNKSVSFRMGWKDRVVYGGPFMQSRGLDGFFTVKMAKEINMACDLSIPTKDFSVPPVDILHDGLKQILAKMADGVPIYIGCLGGIGRTGLVMAILARVFNKPEPVLWVRELYNSHAVETGEQAKYVNDFDITELQLIARKLHLRNLIQFWK